MADTPNGFDLETQLLAHGYVGIQMTKLESGHLHLFAYLNGQLGNFLLDTGAGGTVVDGKRSLAFQLKAENTEETATGAGASNLQMHNSLGNELRLGDLTLHNFALVLMDLEHVNRAFSDRGIAEVDGVIGADVLTKRGAIIDYAQLMLYLRK